MENDQLKRLRLTVPFFEGTWTQDRGMGLFLIILVVVIFVVLPLAGIGIFPRPLVDVGFSAMLISGALANRRNRTLTTTIILLTIASITIHWMSQYAAANPHLLLDSCFSLLSFVCFVVIMLMEVFRPGLITLHRVQGAVAGYLSIGFTWGYAYNIANILSPGAIHFATPPQATEIPVARFVYFSFMTLTTVGYGDIIPIHPIARMLAISEALIGQLYPAILIAGVLGLALQSGRHTEDEKDGDAKARATKNSAVKAMIVTKATAPKTKP